jgi:hypothetical protein
MTALWVVDAEAVVAIAIEAIRVARTAKIWRRRVRVRARR